MNSMMNKSIHRDSVWVRVFKQDSEEDRALALQNEWVKAKWLLLNPGVKVEVEKEEE